jgi:ADP-heptose:LPS heptosyltransferase
MQIPQAARFPFVEIPERWMCYAKEQFAAWDFMRADRPSRKVVFLNSFSKSTERNWPLERLIELIAAMRKQDAWRDAGFVINVVPEQLDNARKLFAGHALEHVHLFSAEENFFQLPAILSLCDLIISVETAVMHLANAVHVPVIALMRQKNPEWAPIDKANSTVITVSGRNDWVDAITVDEVMAVMNRDGVRGARSEPRAALSK